MFGSWSFNLVSLIYTVANRVFKLVCKNNLEREIRRKIFGYRHEFMGEVRE